MSKVSARLTASRLLAQVFARKASLSQALLAGNYSDLTDVDVSFTKALCYGTLRFYHRLDMIAKSLLHKPLPPNAQVTYALLLSALYQINYLGTPAYAAVNETVNAAKLLKHGKSSGASRLLNACLRQYLRNRKTIEKALNNNTVALFSHPQWLINCFKQRWPTQLETILEKNNQAPPMCLRVNTLKITRENYLKLLIAAGMTASPGRFSPEAILLNTPCAANKLPHFSENYSYVQDQSPQLAAHLLELSSALRVLDACSAPGGKASHILQREPTIKQLTAIENQASRLDSLRKHLAPYKNQVKIIHAEADDVSTWWDGNLFDRILLDAPCSATGVIRRHPDIKLLRQEKDIKQQVNTQWTLLKALWPLLKPGGLLLYCTCSILPQENDELIARFIKATDDCEEQPLDVPWGIACTVGKQILPTDELDGFYYARLRRI